MDVPCKDLLKYHTADRFCPETRRARPPCENLALPDPMAQPERLRRPSPRGLGRAALNSEPGHTFRRADVDRLLDLDPHHLLARLVERQHRVVVHVELPPVNLGLKHLRPRNHVVPEDDLLRRPPQLE